MVTFAADIGGTSVRIARVVGDPPAVSGEVAVTPIPDRLDEVPAIVGDFMASLGTPRQIGVGCAGLVDAVTGRARWMPHVTGRDVSLRRPLEDRFGVPVAVDNDANLAALAEGRSGAGAGEHMVLMVTLGTGIGVGLVIDGVIEHGRGGLGEAGHMRLADGPECACGAVGCWEALVSGRVLDAAAQSVLGPDRTAADLTAAAADGNDAARRALDEAGRWLGVGIGNLVAALDPDVVVLGGGAAQAGDSLIRPASRYLGDRGGGLAVSGVPPLRPAVYGTSAGLIGAAIAAREVEA